MRLGLLPDLAGEDKVVFELRCRLRAMLRNRPNSFRSHGRFPLQCFVERTGRLAVVDCVAEHYQSHVFAWPPRGTFSASAMRFAPNVEFLEIAHASRKGPSSAYRHRITRRAISSSYAEESGA